MPMNTERTSSLSISLAMKKKVMAYINTLEFPTPQTNIVESALTAFFKEKGVEFRDENGRVTARVRG